MIVLDLSKLRQVCPDVDGKTMWYFDPDTNRYMRVQKDGSIHPINGGRMIARLHGRDIPNPDAMWLKRCEVAGVATTSIAGMKLKPAQTTYVLYHDWQEVKNA